MEPNKYAVNIFDTAGVRDLHMQVEAATPKEAATSAIARIDVDTFPGEEDGTWEFIVFIEKL